MSSAGRTIKFVLKTLSILNTWFSKELTERNTKTEFVSDANISERVSQNDTSERQKLKIELNVCYIAIGMKRVLEVPLQMGLTASIYT